MKRERILCFRMRAQPRHVHSASYDVRNLLHLSRGTNYFAISSTVHFSPNGGFANLQPCSGQHLMSLVEW